VQQRVDGKYRGALRRPAHRPLVYSRVGPVGAVEIESVTHPDGIGLPEHRHDQIGIVRRVDRGARRRQPPLEGRLRRHRRPPPRRAVAVGISTGTHCAPVFLRIGLLANPIES